MRPRCSPPILIFSLVATAGGPQASDTACERLNTIRAIADSVRDVTAGPDGRRRLDRLAEPLYRYDDPARRYSDGTVWAWGPSGRPSALLTLSMQPSPARLPVGRRADVTCARPDRCHLPGRCHVAAKRAGVVMRKFPDAPVPEQNASKRLMQMKDLVRQIKAHEFLEPRNESTRRRYELRALPKPVHRDSDEASGLIDGAIFILAYGVNPELALLLDARREGSSGKAWSYGLGRIAIAEAHLNFKGEGIWSHPGGASGGPRDAYWAFILPAQVESHWPGSDENLADRHNDSSSPPRLRANQNRSIPPL